MTSLLMWCSSHLQGKQFLITLNKTPKFHRHISISEFFIPLLGGDSVVQPCIPCKEYINTILGYFPISQPDQYNIMMVSKCTDEYCIRPSATLWLGQYVHVISNRASAKSNHQAIYCFSLHPFLSLTHLPSLSNQCLAFVTSISE